MSAPLTDSDTRTSSDPTGLHRVIDQGPDSQRVLPQAAQRLDTRRDAASFRQLEGKHAVGGRHDGVAVRREVLEIVATRGKMQNPVTGSGGMLIGTVEEVGPESRLGVAVGDRIATLVSLSLTPLVIEDGLERWDGEGERVPADGYAILFGRSIAAKIPDDLPPALSLSVMDVCGAPALTRRIVAQYEQPVVVVIGGAGKSGSLSLAAAANAGCRRTVGVVPNDDEAALLRESGLADDVVVADARDPIALRDAVASTGGLADITVVCVDVPGCEGGAILATAERGTVIFFSMATSFSAAALGAEGVAADDTMLVGNGYTPGHAAYAMDLLRSNDGVRRLFERRL